MEIAANILGLVILLAFAVVFIAGAAFVVNEVWREITTEGDNDEIT